MLAVFSYRGTGTDEQKGAFQLPSIEELGIEDIGEADELPEYQLVVQNGDGAGSGSSTS